MRKSYWYDKNSNKAVFKIIDGNNIFIGSSETDKEDIPFASRLVGLTIAEFKAKINRFDYKYNFWRKEVNKIDEKIKHLESLKRISKKNKDHFEECLRNEKQYFSEYLSDREDFINKYKHLKQKENNNNEG